MNGDTLSTGTFPSGVQQLSFSGLRLATVCHQPEGFCISGYFQCASFFTCVVILVDRAEVALAATDWRLGLELSAWSVPTPPVASYSSGSVSSDDDELEADEG